MPKTKEEIKYYQMMNRYRSRCHRVGHCLSLAENEEEDAHYWQLYKKALKSWRRLEIPESLHGRIPVTLRQTNFYRPVFNEAYIAYTRQLKQLYKQREKLNSKHKGCAAIDGEIERIKQLRQNCTEYIDRATGEPRPKENQLSKKGEAS